MKYLFALLAAAIVCGCSSAYDSESLADEVHKLGSKLYTVEYQVSKVGINSNLSSNPGNGKQRFLAVEVVAKYKGYINLKSVEASDINVSDDEVTITIRDYGCEMTSFEELKTRRLNYTGCWQEDFNSYEIQELVSTCKKEIEYEVLKDNDALGIKKHTEKNASILLMTLGKQLGKRVTLRFEGFKRQQKD